MFTTRSRYKWSHSSRTKIEFLGQVYPLSHIKAHTYNAAFHTNPVQSAIKPSEEHATDVRRVRGNNRCTGRDRVCCRRNLPLFIYQNKKRRRAPAGQDYLWWEECGLWHQHPHSWDNLTSSLTGHISILQYILQRKRAGGRRDRKGGRGGGR